MLVHPVSITAGLHYGEVFEQVALLQRRPEVPAGMPSDYAGMQSTRLLAAPARASLMLLVGCRNHIPNAQRTWLQDMASCGVNLSTVSSVVRLSQHGVGLSSTQLGHGADLTLSACRSNDILLGPRPPGASQLHHGHTAAGGYAVQAHAGRCRGTGQVCVRPVGLWGCAAVATALCCALVYVHVGGICSLCQTWRFVAVCSSRHGAVLRVCFLLVYFHVGGMCRDAQVWCLAVSPCHLHYKDINKPF